MSSDRECGEGALSSSCFWSANIENVSLDTHESSNVSEKPRHWLSGTQQRIPCPHQDIYIWVRHQYHHQEPGELLTCKVCSSFFMFLHSCSSTVFSCFELSKSDLYLIKALSTWVFCVVSFDNSSDVALASLRNSFNCAQNDVRHQHKEIPFK